MEKTLIEQIYPFIEKLFPTREAFRSLSTLIEERDIILQEYNENEILLNWMDFGRIENVSDFIESEEALLSILYEEFPKKHPLIKNTKKIIDILKRGSDEEE